VINVIALYIEHRIIVVHRWAVYHIILSPPHRLHVGMVPYSYICVEAAGARDVRLIQSRVSIILIPELDCKMCDTRG
jgi:hypothetical protein